MPGSDRLFRLCLNMFVFLMCAQMGMLLTLRSAYNNAEKRMKKDQAQVSFQCGDFQKESNYWDLTKEDFGYTPRCLDMDCPDSIWVSSKQSEDPKEVHVLSAASVRPAHWGGGHVVDVKVQPTKKPITLVLVSQEMMQWTLQSSGSGKEKNDTSFVDEVIVVGSDLVWLEGVDPSTKITYFDKDQICAHPVGWEELKNPENQFRRFYQAMKEYTGVGVSTFQGTQVAREFRVPFRSLLASERREEERSMNREIASRFIEEGIEWRRQGTSLVAEQFHYKKNGDMQSLGLPEKTHQAYLERGSDTLYVINNYRFGKWSPATKIFTPLHLPLKLPSMNWATSMTFNSLNSELLIYNDDRGGEIFAFNVVTGQWRVFATKVGYSLMALHYDAERDQLLGAQYSGRKITKILMYDRSGNKTGTVPLDQPVDFAKSRWKAHISVKNLQLKLKVAHPASPAGEVYSLQPKSWL